MNAPIQLENRAHRCLRLSRRARVLVHDELIALLAHATVRAEVVDIARETWTSEAEALEQLGLLADVAWVTAADETAVPVIGGLRRTELLMRAAALARLLCLHIELLAHEPVGAQRVLELAERVAWGEPDRAANTSHSPSPRWWTRIRALFQPARTWTRFWRWQKHRGSFERA
jgi:hypothetical protein